MKRQSLVLLAVTIVAAGAAGCFSDPVSGLRSGPTILSLDHAAVYVVQGDSTAVTATILDNGGNVLPETDAAWSSADPTIAAVAKDTSVIPGNFLSRAFVRGVVTTGGITTVTVTTRGLTATVRVVVVPALLPSGQYTRTGTATTDTLVIPGGLTTPPDTVIYSAPDTLVVNGTGFLNFDTSKVAASITGPSGTSQGYVVAKTPSQIKVVFTAGASGKVLLQHVSMVTNNPQVGTQPLDTLFLADSMLFAKVRFRGTITQTGDTVTIVGGPNVTFTPTTTVLQGSQQQIIISQTATTLQVLDSANYTGLVTLKNAKMGVGTLPAFNSEAPATVTAAGFAYPGAITQAGDTLTVAATGVITFDSLTRVAVGATNDSVIGFDATHLFVLAGAASTGVVNVKNSLVGIARLGSLKTAASYTTTVATVPASAVTQVGDTITVASSAGLVVDSTTTVAFGATNGTILTRSAPSSISVLLGAAAYTGVITVKNPLVGVARIAALKTGGSYTVAQASFLGTLTQVGDTLTITAPTGVTFDSLTSVLFGTGNPAIILSATSTTMNVLSPVNFTGNVQVTNAKLGTVRVPALRAPTTTTINGASFPDANVSVGGGLLGDTITITAPTGYAFGTGSKPSMVLAGNMAIATSDTAWILTRTASTITALAKRGGGNQVRITNVAIPGGLIVPYLTTPSNFPIDSINSVFVTATKAAAKTLTIPASDTAVVYGSVNAADANDHWTFTTTAPHLLNATLAWFGTGNPYNSNGSINAAQAALTADLDLMLCNTTTCDETEATPGNLLGYTAATAGQPEKGTTTSQPAGQYFAVILPFTGPYTVTYKLTLVLK